MTLFAPTSKQANSTRTVGRSSQSVFLITVISLVLVGGLGARLAYLQLIKGATNDLKATENQVRLIPKPPERGRIYDRKGKLLATSRISHAVYVWPIETRTDQWPATRARLAKTLKLSEDKIQERIDTAENQPYRVRVARDITPKQIVAIQEQRRSFKGVEVEPEPIRYYPGGDFAAHVLGYTREVTADDLARLNKENPKPTKIAELQEWEFSHYRPGDVIGKGGLEYSLEKDLRGSWGGEQVQVNAAGSIVKVIGEQPAQQGQDIYLTIDLKVQQAAEKVLGNRMGAVVAMNPQNGEVLAMVSRPAFDPNLFSKPLQPATWSKLNDPIQAPLVNRALSGYPPASTFKIVTTTAGIESKKFSPDVILPTYPFLSFGGIQFWDWNNAGFGPLGFPGAMAMSSDTFFYQVGHRIGGETLIEWTRKFGFGERTGIELGHEEDSGLVPSDAWKRKWFDQEWFLGDTINMSIGQGFLLATPLQVANMFAVPANGGDLVVPHLRKPTEGNAEDWRKPVGLQPRTLQIVQTGLRRVVAGGTAPVMDTPTLPPNAGKTGTAEDPPRKSHTWYGGYAPLDNPEIVVVAFAENSGEGGGSLAAPMVKQILETYFNGTLPGEKKPGKSAATSVTPN